MIGEGRRKRGLGEGRKERVIYSLARPRVTGVAVHSEAASAGLFAGTGALDHGSVLVETTMPFLHPQRQRHPLLSSGMRSCAVMLLVCQKCVRRGNAGGRAGDDAARRAAAVRSLLLARAR